VLQRERCRPCRHRFTGLFGPRTAFPGDIPKPILLGEPREQPFRWREHEALTVGRHVQFGVAAY
jgi:hypothetical protein